MSWPQWSSATQPSVPPVLNPTTPVINSAPTVVPPGLQYTPEQWAQLQQQNWNQWAQWQQQYQQWHQQYGAEYQKSINALAQAAQTQQTPALPNVAVPPPLPADNRPPPPADEPPPPSYTSAPPPTHGYNTGPPPKTNERPPMHFPKNQNWGNQNYRYGTEPQNKRNFEQPDDVNKRPVGNKPGWHNQQQPRPPRDNLEELSEAEKKFDKQFAEWEAQFNKWKEQNAEHPDKEQYREYEKKWESWRAQLLERREQMKRKRLGLTADSPNKSRPGSGQSFNSPHQSFNQPPPKVLPTVPQKPEGLLPLPQSAVPFNKPPPNLNDEPLKFKDSKPVPELDDSMSGFFKPNTGGGIPGLDLVKDDPKTGKSATEDVVLIDSEEKEREKKGPDFDAISKGINTILGDQKLLNMLSLVSQTQNPKISDNLTNTVSTIKEENFDQSQMPFQDQSNQSYEDHSNQGESFAQREFVNFDDQTRSSFTMVSNDQETRFDGPGNFERTQFPNRFGNFNQGNRFGNFENESFGKNNFSGRPDERFPPGPNQNRFGLNQDRFGPNQERFDPNQDRFAPNQERFGPNQDKFGPNHDRFNPNQNRFGRNGPNQDRFGPNQKYGPNQNRFGPNQGKFGPNQENFGPNQEQFGSNQQRFGPNQNRFGLNQNRCGAGPNQGKFGPHQEQFGPNQERFPPNQERFGPQGRNEGFNRINDRNFPRGPPQKGQFNYNNDNNFNQGQYDDPGHNEDEYDENYDYDQVASNFEEETRHSMDWKEEGNYEDENQPPPAEQQPPAPPKITEIFQPAEVIDYDHKPPKSEPEVLIEPIYMFDYRHKPLSRIPIPQRPKWLTDVVRNIREFDPPTVRPYEPPNLRRYPPPVDHWRKDRYQDRWSPHNRRGYNEERRPYNDRYDEPPTEKRREERRSFDYPEEKRHFNRMELEEEKISDTEWPEDDFEPEKPMDFPKFQKPEPDKPNKNVVLIEDLINPPGRFKRPPRIVIILRGPPGSGKTFLAKLIKDKEVENGGSAPRILSLDDYFMVEQEKEVTEEGKKVKIKEMVYEYEAEMEESYRTSLIKSFKKTITDGYFSFIIVDNVNDKVKYFGEMWSYAKQYGFQVYVCQLDLDVHTCSKRNIHGRSEADIEKCVSSWEATPQHHPILDATSLLQSASIPEVEMEEVNSPESDLNEGDGSEDQVARSKWDTFDCSVDNLAKLDGVSKPLRQRTMEEYLQLDTDWTPIKPTKPGQKRVRWADLEEQKQQEKMRAIGFVVGHTDWDRMMDPTGGSSALTQTKYIERTGRFKVDQK
ncbi:YLP motif-containing protein 1-like isoform X2 [Tribolium madens]|uniref:YLP motif-containing protein 1-like isoform X2 n=1 Tax=Tribolium madens TaxID=41895 RepID=UPI001CF71E07|nr:YLP motif-containing protein 1-like isoform X2 [Tribolium madens]